MEISFISLILFIFIFPIFSIVPEWNLTNSGIDLLRNQNSYRYLACKRDMYELIVELYKNISLDNGNIIITNEIISNYGDTKKESVVDFENIESSYKEKISTPVICPKGKYHMYDIIQEKYIIPQNFEEKGDWELKCFISKSNYFLVFYKRNGEYNLYVTSSDVYNLTKMDNFFGEELYDFILYNDDDTEPFQMASIIKVNNFIVLRGSNIYNSTGLNNTIIGDKIITEAKKYTQVVFQNYSDNFYFFTYNNVSDFTCGYTKEYADKDNYNNVSKYDIVVYDKSPLDFENEVEILEMNFSLYNKYAIYKVYDKDTNTTYNGVIDVTLNKIIFNSNENIQTFMAYSNNSMLAIINNKAYKICSLKNSNGTDCINDCSEEGGITSVLDPESGNICSEGCLEGKIMFMPNEVCITNCDSNNYINNGSHCGLCSYFYSNKIYKFYDNTNNDCIATIPEGAYEYDDKHHLLKCGSGFRFNGTTCEPHCYESCYRCSEYSSNDTDQKCFSCKSNYFMGNYNNCIPYFDCLEKTKEKCAKCSNESNKYELCISCNEGYRNLNYTIKYPEFLDCVKEGDPLLINFYYNETLEQYKPCYKTCKSCLKGGNPEFHNCLECKNNLMFKPWDNPYNNCIAYSKYYYRDSYEQQKNLKIFQCPEEAKYKVKEKNFCIDDCKKNDEYNLLFNGNCINNCSFDYIINIENNVCKVNPDICLLEENIIYLDNNSLDIVEILVKTYSSEFDYTDNFISLYNNSKNTNYTIIIYKNPECIKELELKLPYIIFNDCYQKVKEAYDIKDNLITAIAEKIEYNIPSTFYSFFHPKSGIKLDAEKICKNDTITIWGNLGNFYNEEDKLKFHLLKQGINIFDINSDFFTDICYDFDNPLKKDITLNDRIKAVYHNATLCDKGCENKGINYENMSVQCDCSFNDLAKSDIIQNNYFLSNTLGELLDLIGSSNIMVFKCTKYIFRYFEKSVGGFISLCLIAAHISMVLLYFIVGKIKLRIYIFSLTNSYLLFLKKTKNKDKSFPPKKHSRKKEKINDRSSNKAKTLDIKSKTNSITDLNMRKSDIPILVHQNNNDNIIKDIKIKKHKSKKSKEMKNEKDLIQIIPKKNIIPFFEEYMSPSLDDMEYDDAIVKDERTLLEHLKENLENNQIIVNTFIIVDPLKPRSIKIMSFILNLILYFVVDGLFFSEEVISEIYHADENKENFFSYLPRSIDEIFYSTLVSITIGIIEDFFFVDEKKIKGIFKREKDNNVILRKNTSEFFKDIQMRYLAFIIFVSIILFISFYYFLCFNYVYPYTQIEWIKSSVTIFILMQILSVLKCICDSSFRFLSFKLKSEKVYKFGKFWF